MEGINKMFPLLKTKMFAEETSGWKTIFLFEMTPFQGTC